MDMKSTVNRRKMNLGD